MTAPTKLDQLLADAYRHVPLYRRLWGRTGRQQHLALADLPLLTKADLLATPVGERLDSRYDPNRLSRASTSGSTGQPLELAIDSWTKRRRQARFLWALWQAGYRPGQRLMLISSRPAHAIKRVSPWARLARWHYADLYVGQAELSGQFRETRPDVLYGPLSSLLTLCEQHHSDLRPRTVISTSEQLTPSASQKIKSSLGVDVTDFFGMTELGLVACRPSGSPRYLVPKGAFILEFLPCNDASGLERLVVTDLAGGAMPFVRYDTGDLVRRDHTHPERPIVELAGKQLDFLTRPDGTRISPYQIDRALGELEGVRQYRVLQESDYTIHAFLVADGDVQRILALAARRLQALCGDLPVTVTPEAPLPATTSHKTRPVLSRVRPG